LSHKIVFMTYVYQKRNGTTYVYENGKNGKRVCIGKLADDGSIIHNKFYLKREEAARCRQGRRKEKPMPDKNLCPVMVSKQDIDRIGKNVFPDYGCVAFVCGVEHANIEYILLRSILKCYGDYNIVSEEDYGDDGIRYQTNLPFEIYEAATLTELNAFATLVNSCDQWKPFFHDTIERMGWTDETGLNHGICSDDKLTVLFNNYDIAVVVEKNKGEDDEHASVFAVDNLTDFRFATKMLLGALNNMSFSVIGQEKLDSIGRDLVIYERDADSNAFLVSASPRSVLGGCPQPDLRIKICEAHRREDGVVAIFFQIFKIDDDTKPLWGDYFRYTPLEPGDFCIL